jgi:hypothetical protein
MKQACTLLVCLALAGACRSQHVQPTGAAVIIQPTHMHSRYCGHYRYGDQWYYLPSHRHGVDCDHELVDGEWVLED